MRTPARTNTTPKRSASAATSVLYFAYGSNLDRGQMRSRCPSALRVGPATLHGYALAFAGYSSVWNGAVASVVRDSSRVVPGVLYAITREDLARLDRFEGVPRAYERVRREVLSANGTRRRVNLYRQPEDYLVLGPPGWRYLKQISAAYRRERLDRHALLHALQEVL
jgi:gamma-glutamylcyclotransferase